MGETLRVRDNHGTGRKRVVYEKSGGKGSERRMKKRKKSEDKKNEGTG